MPLEPNRWSLPAGQPVVPSPWQMTLIEVDFFNTWLPIFDTQAATAMSTGLDAVGLGGLSDLGALSSDFANIF